MIRIFIVSVLIIAISAMGVALYLRFHSTAPVPQPQSTAVYPTYVPSVVPPNMHTQSAVEASFNKTLAGGEDHVVAKKYAIESDFALVVWSGEATGGTALFKYDDNKKAWVLVDNSGGMWSVAALRALGVPQKITLSLLYDLH